MLESSCYHDTEMTPFISQTVLTSLCFFFFGVLTRFRLTHTHMFSYDSTPVNEGVLYLDTRRMAIGGN